MPHSERCPFWGYGDVFLFAGLAIPCMLLGYGLVKLVLLVFHVHPAVRVAELLPEQFLPEQFPGVGIAEDFEVEGVPIPLGGAIRIAYVATHPYGLGRAMLQYRVNDGPWRMRQPLTPLVLYRLHPESLHSGSTAAAAATGRPESIA